VFHALMHNRLHGGNRAMRLPSMQDVERKSLVSKRDRAFVFSCTNPSKKEEYRATGPVFLSGRGHWLVIRQPIVLLDDGTFRHAD
jgi:hypothetical protein